MKGFLTGFWILITIACFAQTSFTTEQWQAKQEKEELKRLQDRQNEILCQQAKRNESKTNILVQTSLDSISILEKAKSEAIAKIEYDFAMKINPIKVRIETQLRQKPTSQRIVIESVTCD